ncbi:hypothetical protein ACMA46_11770 [Clavibacter sp. Sh2141]|uniref:hypothetical protein n=1 Tax=Clavibacter sp. Sh2141 TaxID=3395374 RepID=UPI0039BC53AB
MSDLETIIQKLVRQELQTQMPAIIAKALDEDRKAHGEAAGGVWGDAIPDRMTVAEAAKVAKRATGTIHIALEGAELHGTQMRKGGKWSIERQCLLAWLSGEPCVHKHNVSPLRPKRPRP